MDDKARKLLSAKEFLAEHKIHPLLEQLTAELVQHKPNTPVDYMIRRLHEVSKGITSEAKRPHVVFVLGGPCVGKGTQCLKCVDEYGAIHLNVGDLLRGEVRSASDVGNTVTESAEAGKQVPSDVVISVLQREIDSASQKTFLLDGFPRDLAQAMQFENTVCECKLVINLECTDAVLRERAKLANSMSPRADYDDDNITARLKAYNAKTRPVLEYYEALGKLHTVDASRSVEDVWSAFAPLFRPD